MMKRKNLLKVILIAAIGAAGLCGRAGADTFVLQNTTTLSQPMTEGLDTDAVGSLYVLGQASLPLYNGPAVNYTVNSYSLPSFNPLFSFNTGVPVSFSRASTAFAVEASGTVDLLSYNSGYTLYRFTNTGTPISQAAIAFTPTQNFAAAAAIDKINQRIYVTQFWAPIIKCLADIGGSNCPMIPWGWQATINQYDFSGHLLRQITMSGNSASPSSCYTPFSLAVNSQGNLVVEDEICKQIFTYSPTGSQLSDVWPSGMSVGPLWTDPSGNVYVNDQYICIGNSCNYGVTEFSSTGQPMTSFQVNAGISLSTDPRIAYISGGNGLLSRYVLDGTPSVAVPVAPIGNVSHHGNTATLSWQASSSPDGDPLTYTVLLGTNPNQLAPAATGLTQTSFTTPALSFGTNYYWQIVTQDYYQGLPVQQVSSPVESFSLTLLDSPPAAFGVITGAGTAVTRATSAQLSWQPTTNSYNDPVVYNVFWSQTPTLGTPVGTTTSTNWPVSNLGFGTTYYWSVQAIDPFGESSWLANGTAQAYYQIFDNRPPPPVVYLSTSASYAEHTASPNVTLGWSPSVDSYNDPTSYQLQIQTSTGAWPPIALGGATSQTLNTQFETTYSWRVTASNPYGGASTAAWQSFIVHLANQPPYPIVYSSPSTIVTRSTATTLTWQNTGDPDGDPTTYSLYLGTNLNSLALVQQGTQTSFSLDFQFGTTYYWSVTATDSFGAQTPGVVQAFLPVFKNSPPGAFAVLTGSGTAVTRATNDTLSWAGSIDPDGDPVGYGVYFGTSPASLPQISTTTKTSISVGPLAFGSTYYWRVDAFDTYGATTTIAGGEQSLLHVFLNVSPSVPVNNTQTGTVSYHGTSPSLSFFWQPSTDPQGDPISYQVHFGTSQANLAQIPGASLGYTAANLATNTAYYYQIVAVNPYGAASASPVNWVYFQFVDSPPGSFAVVSGSGTAFARTTDDNLAWTAASDAYGDPIGYRVYFGTSASALPLVATTQQTSDAVAGLSFGTTYYWRVDAFDPYGATTTIAGGLQTFALEFADLPPAPIVYLSTGSVLELHTSSPAFTFAWTASSNPFGDPISYEFDLSTGTGYAPIAVGSATALTSALAFETTYQWRAIAADPYGGASTGTWQTLIAHLYDQAPYPIVYASTVATLTTRATSYSLAWQATGDPDGDPTSYSLYLSTTAGQQLLVSQGTQTSYPLNLTFGTTYYWRVTATDSFGAQTTGALQTFLPIFTNDPPGPFTIVSGTGTLISRTTSQLLAWTTAPDIDGDTVTYAVSVSTTAGYLPVVRIATSTSYTLNFTYGTTYYWSVAAFNPYGSTTTLSGGTQSFLPIFLNNPPQTPTLTTPFSQSPVVKTMSNLVTVSWPQVSDSEGDPITYTIYFGNTPGSMQALATVSQAQQAGETSLSLRPMAAAPQIEVTTDSNTVVLSLTNLAYYQSYYLQIAASNPYGATTMTGVQSFTLSSEDGFLKAYNYPNPFSPLRGGTNIVFNAPPSGYAQATVEVYSEFQDLLYRQDFHNIAPGISQVHFDGHDRYGRPFYNGSYICRVRFSGPSDQQIFSMAVVK